jgi:hypothetical protein
VKLSIVVQRYGADINGGAELHARYVAERLSRHAEVEVFTTCARDYITWKNELPAGEQKINGITVRRFAVDAPRDPDEFARRSAIVFDGTHSIAAELSWIDGEVPPSRGLVRTLRRCRARSISSCFSARVITMPFTVRAVAAKSVWCPPPT